ncbi:MAG TPA: CDP-glycerol glycerophosphotransferase family protein [Candidatus Limnocylindrales bacterium]|nr:CDP-glycerol glycerophosphotransferase family protein [Candidatus Limnocylindrales bacterium]
MNGLEYAVTRTLLRLLGVLFSLLGIRSDRVVLATARTSKLEGNLLHAFRAMRERRPDLDYVLLLEPYGYGLLAKTLYFLRAVRGMYYLRTSKLVVVDNAWLPVHVAPHPGTTVVQVWHAPGALKRFGRDTAVPGKGPEARFLHRHYDYVVTTSEASRVPWSRAFATPVERVLPLGTPRMDFFLDREATAAARRATLERFPALVGRKVVLYAPTFRGRGAAKQPAARLDAKRLREALPPSYALVLKCHPNLNGHTEAPDGFDVVADAATPLNELFTVTDVLVTDYSSSIFEYALLHKPLVLLVGDLADYERDPGLYVDYRSGMIGTQVADTDGVAAAIAEERYDLSAYDAFVARHVGPLDGRAAARFAERFLPVPASAADGAAVPTPAVLEPVRVREGIPSEPK